MVSILLVFLRVDRNDETQVVPFIVRRNFPTSCLGLSRRTGSASTHETYLQTITGVMN